jgi:hypothetical protein
MNKKIIFIFALVVALAGVAFGVREYVKANQPKTWQFQSIDTMKYSRDLSREKRNDPSFAHVVDAQMTAIANTGATYVAIDTPYDDEFGPMLRMWVRAARRHHLHVWFRGNWSGWEQWFGYPKMDKKTHIAKTKEFILTNGTLFEDGDVFTSCPECENGAGSVQSFEEIAAHRQFLIAEYTVTKEAFAQIDKRVASNYYSMNGDLAVALMDPETTKALDGIVVVDHYVRDPNELARDVQGIAKKSGGKVVLGEFGAPIPDLHGAMNPQQQAQWLQEALSKLSTVKELEGVNYWVNVGGSTAIWDETGRPKPAVDVISKVFKGSL